MSTSQRSLVLAEHSIKVEAGDTMHVRIHSNILKVQEGELRKPKQKSAKVSFSKDSGDLIRAAQHTTRRGKKMTKSDIKTLRYFFDYNSVELTLLFCGILVCLAGIMFESDRFEVDGNASTSMRYAWQRDSVTYIVIFIVMMSFIYLAIVMGNEITGYTPECLVSCFRSRQNALLSAANTIQNQKDDHIEMNFLNPAMAGR